MRPSSSTTALLAALALSGALSAQQTRREVLGGTLNAVTRSAVAKGNSIRVDATRILEDFEVWLDFRGAQDLEYSVFRCYAEGGTYEQVARATLSTNGAGARWYRSPTLDLALLCGSHYVLAVSWPLSATYFFSTADTQALSFGAHTFAHAVGTHPLPAGFATQSNDFAVYYMALRTRVPGSSDADVTCVGQSCSSGARAAPELGSSGPPLLGDALFELQLFGAAEGTLGTILLAPDLLATPLPLAGSCELYLDLSTASIALGTTTFDAALFARFPFPLPRDGSLRGQSVPIQGFALDAASALAVTNALQLRFW